MTDIQTVAESIGNMIEEQNDPTSHTELNPHRFHPSQMGHCRRQIYLRKLGLIDNSEYLGALHVGTVIHDHIEENITPHLASAIGVEEDEIFLEHDVESDLGKITIVGTADVWVPSKNLLIDWKTRSGWYSFDAEDDRYIDQIHAYGRALGATVYGIVYMNKKNLEVRTYPEEGGFAAVDTDRMAFIERAKHVRDVIEDHGIATSEGEVPIDHCDRDDGDPCYFCNSETLDFSTVDGGVPETVEA